MTSTISVMSRRQPFSAFGATSLEHEASVFARHASAEAMRLCASSVVWLKGALGHRNEFSLKTKTLRLAAACVYVKERWAWIRRINKGICTDPEDPHIRG